MVILWFSFIPTIKTGTLKKHTPMRLMNSITFVIRGQCMSGAAASGCGSGDPPRRQEFPSAAGIQEKFGEEERIKLPA